MPNKGQTPIEAPDIGNLRDQLGISANATDLPPAIEPEDNVDRIDLNALRDKPPTNG